MKKGTVFTNIVMFISIISMYLGVVYTASHNITTLISLAVLTIISLVILVMCFSGLNKISDMGFDINSLQDLTNIKDDWGNITQVTFTYEYLW